ncbi:MAG: universal stress protein [Deltaproteobacteria bacterium]|nr:universal stress protein [Deltaproteobacteria bacterium]
MAQRFKNVLLAIDFSAVTDDVVGVGLKFARDYGAQVLLLNVYEEGFAFSGLDGISLPVEDLTTLQHYSASRILALQDKMDALVATLKESGLKVAGRVIEGSPAAMIIDEAENGGFDAVFMGSHGWSGIKKFLMGSVADKVVKNSRCSVMVVRPQVKD